jgi:hypothetical protein
MTFFVTLSAPCWHVFPGGMEDLAFGLTPADEVAKFLKLFICFRVLMYVKHCITISHEKLCRFLNLDAYIQIPLLIEYILSRRISSNIIEYKNLLTANYNMEYIL